MNEFELAPITVLMGHAGVGKTNVALGLALYMLLDFAMGLFLRLTVTERVWGFLLSTAMTLPAVLILHPICTSIEALGGSTWKE